MCVVDRTKIQRRGIRSLDSRGNSGISGGESNGSMQDYRSSMKFKMSAEVILVFLLYTINAALRRVLLFSTPIRLLYCDNALRRYTSL